MTISRRVRKTALMGYLKFLILFGLPLAVQAQEGSASDRHPLFQDDAVLKAVLTAPISQAYAQRDSEVRLYFPGQWAYIDDNGETQRLQVSIRLRGNFRREYCELPPIRLNCLARPRAVPRSSASLCKPQLAIKEKTAAVAMSRNFTPGVMGPPKEY